MSSQRTCCYKWPETGLETLPTDSEGKSRDRKGGKEREREGRRREGEKEGREEREREGGEREGGRTERGREEGEREEGGRKRERGRKAGGREKREGSKDRRKIHAGLSTFYGRHRSPSPSCSDKDEHLLSFHLQTGSYRSH